jgi:hypothetical protein
MKSDGSKKNKIEPCNEYGSFGKKILKLSRFVRNKTAKTGMSDSAYFR